MRKQRRDRENESFHGLWQHPKGGQVADEKYERWNDCTADMERIMSFDQKREHHGRVSLVRRDVIFSGVDFRSGREKLPLIVLLYFLRNEFQLIGVVVHFLACLHPRAESVRTSLSVERPIGVVTFVAMSIVLAWHDACNFSARKNQAIDVRLAHPHTCCNVRIVKINFGRPQIRDAQMNCWNIWVIGSWPS